KLQREIPSRFNQGALAGRIAVTQASCLSRRTGRQPTDWEACTTCRVRHGESVSRRTGSPSYFGCSEAPLGLFALNLFCAEVRLQFFRNPHRTISALIILDQRSKQPGQRHARAIQRVAKPAFSITIFKPKLHPPRLE